MCIREIQIKKNMALSNTKQAYQIKRLSFRFSRFLPANFSHIKKKRIFTRIYTKRRF